MAYMSFGTSGADTLEGGCNVQDWIVANGGNDYLRGWSTADMAAHSLSYLDVIKRDDADTFFAGAGDDTVDGGGGNDTINGGGGNDKLCGGVGKDSLAGNAGSDTFVFGALSDGTPDTGFAALGTADVITDWQGRGVDHIALDGWKMREGTAPGRLFEFVGQVEAQASPHTVVNFRHEGGNTVVAIYKPGDAVADAEIVLLGTHSLTTTDFV